MKNKKKSIFIHVPKCGGMTIEHICHNNNIPIDPINRPPEWVKRRKNFKNIEDEIFEYSFAFVRNPFSRIVSGWKCPWVNGEPIPGFDDEKLPYRKKKWTTEFENFNLFVNKFLLHENDYSFYRWSHIMPVFDKRMKLFDDQGNQLVNFIGRLENLQQDFNIVCDKIGIPRQKLPHINKSKHKHYTEYYDDETREIVAERYAKDIEYFGYKFGE